MKKVFISTAVFDNMAHAKKATKNAINLYNQIRLHVSLEYKTPNNGI